MGESYRFNDFCKKETYIQNVKNTAAILITLSSLEEILSIIFDPKHIVTSEDILYINRSHGELIHLSGSGVLAAKKGISLLRTAWGLVA